MNFFSAIIVSLVSLHLFASSTTVGAIDSDSGDLIIQISDDPSAPPYDAAQLWDAMKGAEFNKILKNDSVKIECKTLLTEPQKVRFGSCAIEIKATKVSKQFDGYGVLESSAQGQILLDGFVGAEEPTWPKFIDLKLAGGQLWITADHQKKLFSLLIKSKLVN